MRRLAEGTSRMGRGQVMAGMRVMGERMIVEFEARMCDRIRAGIEEGSDADAIPYFVEGEWKHFWTSALVPALEAEARRAEWALEADIASRVVRELRVCLGEDDLAELESLVGRACPASADLAEALLGMAGKISIAEGWGIADA